jgi:hypothetical protein
MEIASSISFAIFAVKRFPRRQKHDRKGRKEIGRGAVWNSYTPTILIWVEQRFSAAWRRSSGAASAAEVPQGLKPSASQQFRAGLKGLLHPLADPHFSRGRPRKHFFQTAPTTQIAPTTEGIRNARKDDHFRLKLHSAHAIPTARLHLTALLLKRPCVVSPIS